MKYSTTHFFIVFSFMVFLFGSVSVGRVEALCTAYQRNALDCIDKYSSKEQVAKAKKRTEAAEAKKTTEKKAKELQKKKTPKKPTPKKQDPKKSDADKKKEEQKKKAPSCKKDEVPTIAEDRTNKNGCVKKEKAKIGGKQCKEIHYTVKTLGQKNALSKPITVTCKMCEPEFNNKKIKDGVNKELESQFKKSKGTHATVGKSGIACQMKSTNKPGKQAPKAEPKKNDAKKEEGKPSKKEEKPKTEKEKIKEAVKNACEKKGIKCSKEKKEALAKKIAKDLKSKDQKTKAKAQKFLNANKSKQSLTTNNRTIALKTAAERNAWLHKLSKADQRRSLKMFARNGDYFKKNKAYTEKGLRNYIKGIKDPQERRVAKAFYDAKYPPRGKVSAGRAAKSAGAKPSAQAPTNRYDNTGGSYSGGGGGSYNNSPSKSEAKGGESGGSAGGIMGAIGKLVGKVLNKPQKPKGPPKPPKPICNVFTASERTIKPGESTTLQWMMNHSEYTAISPGVGSVQPRGGSVKIAPTKSTTYNVQAQNRYGYTACPPVRITVLAKESGSNALQQQAPIMSCSPQSAARGARAIVLWQCPEGAARAVGSSTEYPAFSTGGQASGSAKVIVNQSSTFVVRCRDASNREIGRNSCKIEVDANKTTNRPGQTSTPQLGQARASLKVSKGRVASGEKVTIAWQGYNTTNCIIRGPDGFTEQGNKGSVTGRMLQTSTFSLDCKSGGNPLPLQQATITVI